MNNDHLEIARFLAKCIGCGLGGALLCLWLRRLIPGGLKEGAQAVAGIAVSFVAVLFSFFLGFTIVNLWQTYDAADHVVHSEVNELRSLYRLTGKDHEMGAVIMDYAQKVISVEWDNMKNGRVDEKTGEVMFGRELDDMRSATDKLWATVLQRINAGAAPSPTAGEMVSSVNRFNKFRRERLSLAGPSLHGLLGVTIYMLAAFTVGGFFFLAGENRPIQFLIDFVVIASVALSLFLIDNLDAPFSGSGFTVSDEPFRLLIEQVSKGN